MKEKRALWEVKEIDLNLRHYSGNPLDVIKKIKISIENYLSNPDVPDESRKIYSAIYNALDYYQKISYIPLIDFSTEDTFLTNSIDNFNDDYNYLASKYDSKDPTVPPVISINCRIKSPLGFMEKVKNKITEYIEKNRNLEYFNESLRDLIGIRIIINPPKEIQDKGPQAESDFLYQVFYDLMSKHGLNDQSQESSILEKYHFIPVATRYSPNKLHDLKSRQHTSDSSETLESSIFIPKSRIPEVEQPHVDVILKDYNMWPKRSGYQSLHVCVIPAYSSYVEESHLPPYIIPPASRDYAMEYQIRTKKQDDYAEYGNASHKISYKPNETLYHRMAVPFYIDFDRPEEIETPIKVTLSKKRGKKFLKLRNFAESYKRFYGHSFKDRFNISFKDFRNIFSSTECDAVLADQLRVEYDETRDLYYLVKAPTELTIDTTEQILLQSSLTSTTPQTNPNISEILDSYNLTDSIIPADSDVAKTHEQYRLPKSIKIYTISNPTCKSKKDLELTSSLKSNNDKSSKSFDENITPSR